MTGLHNFSSLVKEARRTWTLIASVSFALLMSCGADEVEVPVARVHDKMLYESDLVGLVPPNATPEDSVEVIQRYIDNWVRETVILKQAEENLSEYKRDIDRQLENDRRSLLIFAYEKALIEQKLDTSVSIGAIEEYYTQNRESFLLKDYIVRVLYVKMDTNSPVLDDVEKLYKLRKDTDLEELKEMCKIHAANFYHDDNAWLYFDDLSKEIPLSIYDKEAFLERNKPTKFEDGGYVYYLNVLEYKLKDNISPLPLQQENIRNIIINQRKVQLIEKMRLDLYNDGLDHKHIEIFTP